MCFEGTFVFEGDLLVVGTSRHFYKWALRVVEGCVLSATPGQPKRDKETS